MIAPAKEGPSQVDILFELVITAYASPKAIIRATQLGGKAVKKTCFTSTSKAAVQLNVPQGLGLEKVFFVELILPVKNCRNIGKKDMLWNDNTPEINIDPETYEVTLDGKIATVDAAKELSLAQRYFMA
jgi:urease subunit alpha